MCMLISVTTVVVVIVVFLRIVHLFRIRLRTRWSFKSDLI
jgi:hypothetical protein